MPRPVTGWLPAACALLLVLVPAAAARAQLLGGASAAPKPVPFGPGERVAYQVGLSPFGTVGNGSMEVLRVDTVRGSPAYHLRFKLQGGIPFAKVDDRMDSWLDVAGLFSHRFEQDQHEVNYKRHRIFDFYPSQGIWRLADGRTGPLAHTEPLDDISFLYFARTLPLEVGRSFTLPRYFKADGNPVQINVVRRDTVTVPAGTFRTIVVQPIIQTDGLFGKGGKAEIHFTDDERRLLVYLKSDVPILGSLRLSMSSYSPGEPLVAGKRAGR